MSLSNCFFKYVELKFKFFHFNAAVCFQPISQGKCLNSSRKSVQRWAYSSDRMQCVTFNYSGCNGNQNRFATEYMCNLHCKGLKRPLQGWIFFFFFCRIEHILKMDARSIFANIRTQIQEFFSMVRVTSRKRKNRRGLDYCHSRFGKLNPIPCSVLLC